MRKGFSRKSAKRKGLLKSKISNFKSQISDCELNTCSVKYSPIQFLSSFAPWRQGDPFSFNPSGLDVDILGSQDCRTLWFVGILRQAATSGQVILAFSTDPDDKGLAAVSRRFTVDFGVPPRQRIESGNKSPHSKLT